MSFPLGWGDNTPPGRLRERVASPATTRTEALGSRQETISSPECLHLRNIQEQGRQFWRCARDADTLRGGDKAQADRLALESDPSSEQLQTVEPVDIDSALQAL
jgi:hypothetical protein